MLLREIVEQFLCSNPQSFYQLLKVVGENGLEWRAIVRKEQPGGAKRLKKLFEQRKTRLGLCYCYRTDRHLVGNPGTPRRESGNFGINRNPRESYEKEFDYPLDSNYFAANKIFWQTISRLRGKRSRVTYSNKDSAENILIDRNEIFSRWRKYYEDLLNPKKASINDTQEVMHLGKVDVLIVAEVETAIKR